MTSKIFLFLAVLCLPEVASSNVRVVTTTTDIAWLVHRIGGKKVEVKTLARPSDDYHFLDARPDFILAVNRADVVCRIGADLEIGWLPKILEKAANTKVMSGGVGDCDLSRKIAVHEKPSKPVDRSMGDVHPSGNPHYWLSAIEMAKAAVEVEERLSAVDPGASLEFKTNRLKLQEELKALHEKIKDRLKPFHGRTVIEYHKDFSYFSRDYGFHSMGSIEEVPGVSPSAARLGKVSMEANEKKAAFAMASSHHPKSQLHKFQELSGVRVVTLPTSLSDPTNPDAYSLWQNAMAEQILTVLK